MGALLILVCTLIGYLCGSALLGLAAGLIIVFVPLAVDEYDRAQRMRRIRRQRERAYGRRR